MKSPGSLHVPGHEAERPAYSRVETTYQQIKHDIIEGVYTPRQRLIETDLAALLGVSRATLRAALLRLQHEGFVEIRPEPRRSGARLQCRRSDPYLAGARGTRRACCRACRRKGHSCRAAELHGIVVEMENTLAADDLLGHLPLVGRFHQRINEIAGNEFIEQFLSMLRAPLIRHQFRVILVPGRKDESLMEHREILAYLTGRDAMGAERAMRRHIAALRNSLQQANQHPLASV